MQKHKSKEKNIWEVGYMKVYLKAVFPQVFI